MKTKILPDFQICISVTLITRTNIFDKWSTKGLGKPVKHSVKRFIEMFDDV